MGIKSRNWFAVFNLVVDNSQKNKTSYDFLYALAEIINVNQENWNDQTALHLAVENGETKLVEIFLERNAEIEHEARFMMSTPLFQAVKRGIFSTVEILLKYGANPNVSGDVFSESPLEISVERNKLKF